VCEVIAVADVAWYQNGDASRHRLPLAVAAPSAAGIVQ
jgi:hypothetical protein